MQFERQPMVGWYDVKQLASTGIKTVVSLVFGNFADKREMQAVAVQDEPHDFSKKDDIWIDFISDLGDGFNPTYTLAQLMAKDEISLNGETLNRGDLLIMGGDEVYPTPEKIEYKNRLQGPYNAAFPWKEDEPKEDKPKLFAIPGNHDWYDGLTNFLRLFCQGRALGNWLTQQKRSYFALKLPHNYWLIGVDIQLKGDIDEPQKAYFRKIASNEFKRGDKVIFCTAEPTWAYASMTDDFDADNRMWYFINKILKGADDAHYNGKNKDLDITVILTGDLHHYSRYEAETDKPGKKMQLITSGGGGAFMHPTHMLGEEINFKNGFFAQRKEVFPSLKDSRKLCWLNLAFPLYNWSMCLFLGILHLLTAWVLQSATQNPVGKSFMESASGICASCSGPGEYLQLIIKSISYSPAVVILNLLLFGGILMFTDVKTGKKKWNYIAGFIHSILQISTLYGSIWLFSRINLYQLSMPVDSLLQVVLFSAEMIFIGGLLSGIFFGIYLLVSILVFKSHPTEASSSFKYEGYKNFLRIHLTRESLTIYAIGLKTVFKDWKNVGSDEKPIFEGDFKDYSLIEKITINHN